MKCVTFTDTEKKRVMIHRANCGYITYMGVDGRYKKYLDDDTRYVEHDSYDSAKRYAQMAGMRVCTCSMCKPER